MHDDNGANRRRISRFEDGGHVPRLFDCSKDRKKTILRIRSILISGCSENLTRAD